MSTQETDLLFARQPIFDSDNRLFGHELLYRSLNPTAAIFSDGDKATSELLVNYCSAILHDDTSPDANIFINLTRSLIMSESFFPLEPQRIIIEILEDTKVDEELVERIKTIKSTGYRFALDDYSFDPRFNPLLPLVDFIKFDLTQFDIARLAPAIKQFKSQSLASIKRPPCFVAEKVETDQQHLICLEAGIELFQGYFLERPQPVYGKKIANNSELALEIVAKLQEPNVDIDEICVTISRDTKLSYQVLKIINSPVCRLARKVSSLKEAVVYLGLEQLKKWAMAMALSNGSEQPPELFRILLQRARTCELYATARNFEFPEKYFTAGLFSGIDAVMLADKAWLLDKLKVSDDLQQAILYEAGSIGKVITLARAADNGDWQVCEKLSHEENIELFSAHENAISWTNSIFSHL